jgi:hypothetical protein
LFRITRSDALAARWFRRAPRMIAPVFAMVFLQFGWQLVFHENRPLL